MSNINAGTSNIPLADNDFTRWYRTRNLMCMTAWQQVQPKDYNSISVLESEQNKEAVRMLTYIASLDYFIYDLIDEMTEAGKYKQGNKRNINRCKELIEVAHSLFCHRMVGYDPRGLRQYHDAMDIYHEAINECVALTAPERAYNIIVAVVRLQSECRNRISRRYFYKPSKELDKIPSLLEGLGITDYKLDNIIDRQIRNIPFRVNNAR